MSNVQVSPQDLRQAIKNWIDDTSISQIIELYKENFDEDISFNPHQGLISIPLAEAERIGITRTFTFIEEK